MRRDRKGEGRDSHVSKLKDTGKTKRAQGSLAHLVIDGYHRVEDVCELSKDLECPEIPR